MGTSVYVELGNGKNFIFDMGPGSIANYLAAGIPLNQINDIFITHSHWDHVASVPYIYMFGGWGGRWHESFRVHGPSGRTEKHGFKYMMERMDEMLTWHKDSFDLFPVGKGWDMEVNEFDFTEDGGVVYEQNGVKTIHWRQSHTEDGASAYRLDWNGMCVAWQSIRDAEIPPEKYYPEGYQPELLFEWPTDKPLFIPAEMMPGAEKED